MLIIPIIIVVSNRSLINFGDKFLQSLQTMIEPTINIEIILL